MKVFTGQKFLMVYSGVLTAAFTGAMLTGFAPAHAPKFDTITVQRINIVEPDGTLRMVLTNNHRIPGPIFYGREYPDYNRNRKGTTRAGMFFYDGDGTESGGLIYWGEKDAQGRISRGAHLAFDRYNQDQTLTIGMEDDGTNYGAVIRTIERPNWSLQEYLDLLGSIQHLPEAEQQAAIARFLETHPPEGDNRIVLGSETYGSAPSNNASALLLSDSEGRNRARLLMHESRGPSLEFLDESGNVTHRYPPN